MFEEQISERIAEIVRRMHEGHGDDEDECAILCIDLSPKADAFLIQEEEGIADLIGHV